MREAPRQRTGYNITAGMAPVVALLLTIILAGIACRLAPLGLSPSFRKWSGSVLWGGMFWSLAALIARGRSRLVILVLAVCGATLSETIKQLHFPWLDTLRATGVGAFVLGSHFAYADLIAYAAGACLTGLLMTQAHMTGNMKKRE